MRCSVQGRSGAHREILSVSRLYDRGTPKIDERACFVNLTALSMRSARENKPDMERLAGGLQERAWQGSSVARAREKPPRIDARSYLPGYSR